MYLPIVVDVVALILEATSQILQLSKLKFKILSNINYVAVDVAVNLLKATSHIKGEYYYR